MRRKSAAHHAVKVAVPGGRCLVNDAAVNGEACTLVAADGKFVLSKYRFLKDVIKNRQILSDLAVILSRQPNVWSEWRESNSRPLEPHSSALPNCATPGRTGLSQISLHIITDCAENVNTLHHKKLRILTFLIFMDYAATVEAVPKIPIVDQLDPKFTTKQKPPDP